MHKISIYTISISGDGFVLTSVSISAIRRIFSYKLELIPIYHADRSHYAIVE